tara:strand:- start:1131 stop:1739 length:609 start_codon:yes stop_codon:yes gene_type:complete
MNLKVLSTVLAISMVSTGAFAKRSPVKAKEAEALVKRSRETAELPAVKAAETLGTDIDTIIRADERIQEASGLEVRLNGDTEAAATSGMAIYAASLNHVFNEKSGAEGRLLMQAFTNFAADTHGPLVLNETSLVALVGEAQLTWGAESTMGLYKVVRAAAKYAKKGELDASVAMKKGLEDFGITEKDFSACKDAGQALVAAR